MVCKIARRAKVILRQNALSKSAEGLSADIYPYDRGRFVIDKLDLMPSHKNE
jgi:hypothetical protein